MGLLQNIRKTGGYQRGRWEAIARARRREMVARGAAKFRGEPYAAVAAKQEKVEIKKAAEYEKDAVEAHKLDENLLRLAGAVELQIYNEIKEEQKKEEDFLLKEKKTFAVMGRIMQDIKKIDEFNKDMQRWIELRKRVTSREYAENVKGVLGHLNDHYSVIEIGEKIRADQEGIRNLIKEVLQGLNYVILVLREVEKVNEESKKKTEGNIKRVRGEIKAMQMIVMRAMNFMGMRVIQPEKAG